MFAELPENEGMDCTDPQTQLDICLCDAWVDFQNCRTDARDLLALATNMDVNALIFGALLCIGASVYIGGPLSLAICILGALGAVTFALSAALQNYAIAKAACVRNHNIDVARCERDHG